LFLRRGISFLFSGILFFVATYFLGLCFYPLPTIYANTDVYLRVAETGLIGNFCFRAIHGFCCWLTFKGSEEQVKLSAQVDVLFLRVKVVDELCKGIEPKSQQWQKKSFPRETGSRIVDGLTHGVSPKHQQRQKAESPFVLLSHVQPQYWFHLLQA
jgi:hypothetical protein